MGMSMAVMNDPSSGASTTVLAELINVYAILLFFAMDGHLLLVSILFKEIFFLLFYDIISLCSLTVCLKG